MNALTARSPDRRATIEDPPATAGHSRARVLLVSLFLIGCAITPAPATAQADPNRPGDRPAVPAPEEPKGHRFFPLPFLFYQPETRLGGGGGLLHTYRPEGSARTNTDQLMVIVTARSQYSVGLRTESFPRAGAWMIAAELGASRFPDLFYGVGNDTRLAAEEDYTLDQAGGAVDLRRALSPSLFLGPSMALRWSDPHGFEQGGGLEGGEATGIGGGLVAGAGASLLFDRRDHTLTPTSGSYLTALARVHDPALGSDFAFSRIELDGRAYRTFGPGKVLAVQALATAHTGEPPFYELARLGGAAVLRGSYEGRYRDRHRLFGQAEYRFHAWRRVGGALFAGAGQVGRDWDDMRLDGIHVAGGAGLRFLVSRAENVNIRVDWGVARGESGLYFGFAEAF